MEPGSLADFGLLDDVAGTWTLMVEDRAALDVGVVAAVVLQFE